MLSQYKTQSCLQLNVITVHVINSIKKIQIITGSDFVHIFKKSAGTPVFGLGG